MAVISVALVVDNTGHAQIDDISVRRVRTARRARNRGGSNGREIVARHIAARGGRDKLAAIQTVKLTRTVGNGIGTPLKVVIYKKRPNLFRLEQALVQPGATMTPRGINGEAVWDVVQGKPVTRETQLAAESRDLEGDFDGWLVDWKEKGYTVAFAGREASPAGELLKLAVTLKSGLARTVYLDAKGTRFPAHGRAASAQRPDVRRHLGL